MMEMVFHGAPVRLTAAELETMARRSSARLRETLESLEARRDAASSEAARDALDRAVARLETSLMRVDLQIADARIRARTAPETEIDVEFGLLRLMSAEANAPTLH